MESIDELGRTAAQAALADAERDFDIEDGLARILTGDELLERREIPPRRRWPMLAAAAAVVAIIAAGVVWSQQDPSPRMAPDTTPDVPPEPTTPPPTEPSTITPTTRVMPLPPPRQASGLRVSYRNPPPVLEPEVFASLDASIDGPFAVTETGGAVAIDHEAGEAIVVELDGSSRRVPIAPRAIVLAAGPGDVLYAFLQGTAQGLRAVAVPLSGDRAGQVVAEAELDPAFYTELPTAAFGHGPTGIIDRVRRDGEKLIGYVDATGEPFTWPAAPPSYTVDFQSGADPTLETNIVRSADGSIEWALDIERHPDSPETLEGPTTPAPAAGGGVVYWTGIGPPDDPTQDYPSNTMNVIALLSADGSAQWYRLPKGWSVAASDVWGTILTRRNGDQVQLATLDPLGEPVDPRIDGLEVVDSYLGALAEGRYDDAAQMLRGTVGWEQRADLAGLPQLPDSENLAGALRAWCEAGAACQIPTVIALEASSTIGGPSTYAARFDIDGTEVTASFTGAGIDGAPTVTGLPPLARPSALPTLAETIGASKLIAREPGTATVFADGTTNEVATPEDAYVQTDGSFLWWDTTGATLDGTIVCEVDGPIYRMRQRADGGYVASFQDGDPDEGAALPNFEVDCESGVTREVAPVTWFGETGIRYIEHVGDRTFTHVSYAEDDADVSNENGASIDGDDHAGYHTFSANGSQVAYGDMGGPSRHRTKVVRSRDTTTGELLWTAYLERPVAELQWYGDRILANGPLDGMPGDYVTVIDARTGDVIKTVPTSLDIAFVG